MARTTSTKSKAVKADVTKAKATKPNKKDERAFKTRAAKIQAGVGKAAKVVINEEKPRKGSFVVKVSGVKEPIVELLDLKRPFGPLKSLDMEEVIEKIMKAL